MRKTLAAISVFLAFPALQAQETEIPRIEPEPRWDVESIREYFRQKEIATTKPAEAVPETPQVPVLPIPSPVATQKTLLHGLSPEAVTAKLGKPTLDRRDGRVRLLQFAHKPCTLDVVLWRSASTTYFTVHYVESRNAKSEKSDVNGCLQKQYALRGLTYEMVVAPIPPAPPPPAPELKTEPLPPPAAPGQPQAAPQAPTPPQPAPGLSYPLGGQTPPQ